MTPRRRRGQQQQVGLLGVAVDLPAVALDPIRFDVANALVDVHFDVTFNRSDKDANTPYLMDCKLMGYDFVPDPGEDNLSDPIPGGRLTRVGGETITADGLDPLHFDLSTTLARENLNEDVAQNPDETKARVTLTPIVASPAEAESNVRTLSA